MKEDKYKKIRSFYNFIYYLLFLPIMLIYPVRGIDRKNIPENAAIYCGNHSSWVDPFLIAYAAKRRTQIRFLAKVELFNNKLASGFLKGMGMIPVNRGKTDLNCIKQSLVLLRDGENLGIFPEGTRMSEDYSAEAKNGAIKMAEKSGRPIVPVHIPRKKRPFMPVRIVFGEPYYINPQRARLSPEEYDELARDLMVRINSLDRNNK